MKIPDDLMFTAHDEWVRAEGEDFVVGITDFAQDQLGELVHVELPAVGKKVRAGEVACEVESSKTVAEIFSPVDGEIVAVNGVLADAAERINSDPYGAWIFRIRASAPPAGLLDAAAYRAKVG